jgi:hypothetical protein
MSHQPVPELRFLWMSRWDMEIECSLYGIEVWKEIGAPQYWIDGLWDAIYNRKPWW